MMKKKNQTQTKKLSRQSLLCPKVLIVLHATEPGKLYVKTSTSLCYTFPTYIAGVTDPSELLEVTIHVETYHIQKFSTVLRKSTITVLKIIKKTIICTTV